MDAEQCDLSSFPFTIPHVAVPGGTLRQSLNRGNSHKDDDCLMDDLNLTRGKNRAGGSEEEVELGGLSHKN